MRISDWSSDVCSSDLGAAAIAAGVSATQNDLSSTTRAGIAGAGTADDSTRTEIQTQTGLDVKAVNESRIVSVSMGVAAAVAAGQGFAGAGAGAGSGNSIANTIEARINNVDTPTGDSGPDRNQGEVSVQALNEASIVTVAGALGVAVSAGSAGVGASVGVSGAISDKIGKRHV